jgi:hypothetical protein
MTDISASDKELIVKLRALIEKDLQLVPSYSDDYSLLRWIIGWDRKMGGSYFNVIILPEELFFLELESVIFSILIVSC